MHYTKAYYLTLKLSDLKNRSNIFSAWLDH